MRSRAALPAWPRRLGDYALALLLVALGVILRAALTHLTGPDLPTYITFYPLVMLAALLGGWGPGLLATLATVAVVVYWLLAPTGQLRIGKEVDLAGLVFFCAMGVFMSIVAELYRHLRDHLEELVLLRTTALSQANEQSQTQAEELANANAALRASEDKFKAIFNQAALGLAICDPTGLILDCNSAYQELVGYSKDELRKKRFLDITHPDDIGKNRDLQRQMNEGVIDTYRLEKRYLRPDGQAVWCNLIASAIRNPDGTLKYNMAVAEDITRRKHAEEALRESEERFRIMADGSPNPIWVTNAEGERIFANRQYLEYFGVSEQEMKGGKWKRFLHPDDAPTYVNSFLSSLKERRPFFAEARVERADGQWRWIESHAEPRFSLAGEFLGFVGITQDITERKEAEAAVKESEDRYRSIVETAAEAIMLVDAEARILFVNDRWTEMFGYSREESLRMSHSRLIFPEDLAVMKKRWEARKHGQKESYELRLRRKDGRPVWAMISVSPKFGLEGEFLGTLNMIADISTRKKAEEALHELNATLESKVSQRTEELEHRARQLQKLTLELTEAEERERARIAEILHDDLQQVLAAAKFQMGLLSSRVRNDTESLEMAGQAKNLLVDAIAKSRSLSHELSSPALSESDLSAAFEWLVEQVQEKHGFTVHLETGARTEVASEPLRILLYKAAQELLFNAIKHAGVAEAKLRLRRQRGYLRLSVSDRGRGFDPTDPGCKLGFGLRSLRERIELLGGRMTIRSAPGKGSTFLIVIPDGKAGGVAPEAGTGSNDETIHVGRSRQ